MESHLAGSTFSSTQVTTANGIVEGTTEAGAGIRMFKGIPFAARSNEVAGAPWGWLAALA